jgi:acyl carrier protein
MNSRENHLIQQQLIDFLHHHADVYDEFDATTDLIAEGILDSLLVTDLVLFTQRHFGVELTVRDISPEHMSNIERMACLIQSKREKLDRAA